MKICAIIAEFNPFHNGHRHILNIAKKSFDACVVIMSGSFVQRGGAAVYDKFSRARAGVLNGADLVIELPVIYSLSSAPYFARGAVNTLHSLGIIDSLLFGSECADIHTLQTLADILDNESDGFKTLLLSYQKDGLSYPAARQRALLAFTPLAFQLEKPNNILGVEYLRALRHSGMYGVTIPRKECFQSATSLRAQMNDDGISKLEAMLLYALRTATTRELTDIFDCDAPLAARIMRAASETSARGVIDAVKCKTYTESRIRRALCNLLIKNNISPERKPEYIRVLAIGENGAKILKEAKAKASLPIITKPALIKENDIFQTEARACDIYNITRFAASNEDFTHFLD